MTQTPPPPPPDRPRHPEEIWAAIARDYRAGESTLVLAERYAVSDRSVRRRAALESWRRDADEALLRPDLRDPGATDRLVYPALAWIDDLNGEDLHDLLFEPDPRDLSRFAFRRAAECAALDGPAQTAAWLRVSHLASQLTTRGVAHQVPYSQADYLRAEMMHVPPRPPEPDD